MTEQDLLRYLQTRTGRPIVMRVNDNTQNLLTAHNGKGREVRVSVHRIFLDAPPAVREALAAFVIRPNEETRRVIREYIAANTNRIAPARPRAVKRDAAESIGEYYDLAPIAARLNRTLFANKLKFDIVWGRRPKVRPRRMSVITLGLCQWHQKTIRIHPILDSPKVPQFYLEYIIYHEMVHMAMPSQLGANGKLMHHTEEFYQLERRFPRYRQALQWQDRNLYRLISSWCRPVARRPARSGQLRLFA